MMCVINQKHVMKSLLFIVLQILQEFQHVAVTNVRLLDKWQQYKERILQLAASKPATQHLLEGIDDLDEGLLGFTIFVKIPDYHNDLNYCFSNNYKSINDNCL